MLESQKLNQILTVPFILLRRIKAISLDFKKEGLKKFINNDFIFKIYICKSKTQKCLFPKQVQNGTEKCPISSNRHTLENRIEIPENPSTSNQHRPTIHQHSSLENYNHCVELASLKLPANLKSVLQQYELINDLWIKPVNPDELGSLIFNGFVLIIGSIKDLIVSIRTTDKLEQLTLYSDEENSWHIFYIRRSKHERITIGGRNPFFEVSSEAKMFHFRNYHLKFLQNLQTWLTFNWNSNEGFFENNQVIRKNSQNNLELVFDSISQSDYEFQTGVQCRKSLGQSLMIPFETVPASTKDKQLNEDKLLENYYNKERKRIAELSLEELDKLILEKRQEPFIKTYQTGFVIHRKVSEKVKGISENNELDAIIEIPKRVKISNNLKNAFVVLQKADFQVDWCRFGTIRIRLENDLHSISQNTHQYFWMFDLNKNEVELFVNHLLSEFCANQIILDSNNQSESFLAYKPKQTVSNVYYLFEPNSEWSFKNIWEPFLKNNKSIPGKFNLPQNSIFFIFAKNSIEKTYIRSHENVLELQPLFLQLPASNSKQIINQKSQSIFFKVEKSVG